MNSASNRRQFLAQAGAGAVLAAGYTATARGFAANETINIGCIGTGGRCRKLMQSLPNIEGVRVTAVCDIWDEHLRLGKELADAKAAATKDYHELLARKDVDAVIIGAPDHWHVPLTIDACAAGKDVYVEKPLTHDLSEGQAVIEAQNKHRRIVQVGTQQRSMPHIQKAREILQSGQLGTIHKVHLTWNRNSQRTRNRKPDIDAKTVDWKRFLGAAPAQSFDPYRFRNWRWFWDFGGGIFTDLMVHWIDVAHWLLDLDQPQFAASIGDFNMAQDLWETPDTVQTLLKYPQKNVQAYFEGTFSNARNGAMIEFMGTEATLYIDRGRHEIHPERTSKLEYSEMVLGSGPRGADFYDKPDGETLHLANWIECIRSRKTPTAPAEAGVSGAAAAHLANLSLRSGSVAVTK
ncbi:MAG: Gfo/Idh/MocA family oxidoreductase [Pirellulaceae bacterium]